ncbi:hypothetical protein AB0127_27240, partial [Klebsiella pneumoniae]
DELSVLVHDADLRVRFVVAERCAAELLHYLTNDRDAEVQAEARRRIAALGAQQQGGGDGSWT